MPSLLIRSTKIHCRPFSDCAGNRERGTGAAPGGYCGEIQRGLELPAGEEQPPRVLSVPGRAQELLLLQGDPKDESIVASRFMHDKYADFPEAPLVATPMKVTSFSISSRH
jgi:hypothetical protein